MPKIQMYTSALCSYCVRAQRLLDLKGVEYEEIYLPRGDTDSRLRLAKLTGRYTVPQIIVDGQPLGGYDELRALDDAGELDPIIGVG